LRKNFKGTPEHVINFMYFVAEELRQIMASLGFRTVDEMVGQSQKIDSTKAIEHYKAQGIDLSAILYQPENYQEGTIRNTEQQVHDLENALDFQIIQDAHPAIYRKEKMQLDYPIHNTDRAVGAIISNEISKIYGAFGLPQNTLQINFTGSAGQSFGAFATHGLTLKIEGNTNDYLGKGLSGATLIVKKPENADFVAEENIIVGNVCFYGATKGQAFINGVAGERFCVRNSGITAVVEGLGDHGCEYMTGGKVVVIGNTGRNFAAGMSGGIAYVYDKEHEFRNGKCNMEMVELEELDKEEVQELFILIKDHYHATDSNRAMSLLENWEKEAKHFVKVMPTDYKKALERLAKEKKEKQTA
jgi:glutamate synthase (ferredoxin)